MAPRPSSGVVAAARVLVVSWLVAAVCATITVSPFGNDGAGCLCPSQTCLSLSCGIQSAALGETVNVLAGTYTGSLNRGLTPSQPVRIIGASQASVVIDLRGADRFMTLTGWSYAIDSIIANVSIINGNSSTTGSGGALRISNGAPVIQNVLFKNCLSASDGGAIDITTSSATIIGCTFDSNKGVNNGVGGAIHIAFNWAAWGQSVYPVVTISNCTFTRNSAPHGGALGLDGDAIVTDSLITLNSATSCGGGVRIASPLYTVAFRNTAITMNSVGATGGGISVRFTNQISGSTYYYSFIEIENCTFSGNTNGGLNMYSSCAFITGTTFDTFSCNTEYAGTVLVDWRYPNKGASMTGGCSMSNVTAPNLTAVNDSNAQSSAYQMTVVGRTFTQTLSGNQLTLRGSASQSATCALKQANTGSLNADCSGVEAGYYCLSVLIYKKESNALNYTRYPYLTAISPSTPTNGNTATLTGVGFSAATSARTPSVYLGATAQTVLGWDTVSITIRVVGTPTQGLASFCAVMNGVPSNASCAAYGSTAPRCNSTTTAATTTTSTTSTTPTTSSTSSTTSTTSTTSSSATASTSSTTSTTSSSSSSSTSSTSTTAIPSTSSTTSTTTASASSSTSSSTTVAASTSSTTSTTGSTSTSTTSSTSSSTSTTSSASTSSTTSTTSSSGNTSTTGANATTTTSSTSTAGSTSTATAGSSTTSTTSTANSSTSSTSGTGSSTTAGSPSTTSAGAQTATTSSVQGSSTSASTSDSTSSSTAPAASSTTDSTTNSADGLSTSTTAPRDALSAALDSIDENRRTAIIAGSVVGGAVLLAILIVVLILLIGSMRRATKAGSGRHSARVAPVVPGDGGAQELAVAEFDEGEYKSREDMLRDRHRGDSAGGDAGGASAGGGGTTPRPTDVSIMIGGTEVSVSIGKQ